jgi:hypothetical protein
VRCVKLSIAIACAVTIEVSMLSAAAFAEPDATTKKGCVGAMCFVIGSAGNENRAGNAMDHKAREHDPSHDDQGALDAKRKFAAALAVYDRELARYKRCLRASPNAAACGQAPESPWLGGESFSGRGKRPITAGQAAAIAVARLQLPTVAPGIGPSPDLNRWNMAAVGYPLWLWADGPTHVRVRSKHENCHGESRHLRQDLV